MPRGLVRSDPNSGGKSYRNGLPVTTPIDFGTDITLPHDFGNDVNWSPDPAHFGNAVTWAPSPAHFGNKIAPPFAVPTFTSATPNNGPVAGGTPVAIVGSGFSATGLEVLIGGALCTSVVASDDTHLTCLSPAGSVGLTDIEIVTDGGSVDAPNAWTYNAAAITLVSHSITTGNSFSAAGITTSAIDSTGASLLFLVINAFTAPSSQTSGAVILTDSKGNIFRPVPYGTTAPSPGICLFYCSEPVTGPGHTVQVSFSDTGAGGYVGFSAWSNTHGLVPQGQVVNSGNTNHAAPFKGGSLSGNTGDLILSCIGGYNGFSTTGLPATVDTGFTIIDSIFASTPGGGGGCGGLAYGYLLAPNTTAVNPTWTMQAAVTGAMVVNVIFAKASSATVQLVARAKAASGGATTTTSAINTTGANFLIASVQKFSGSGGPPTITDSLGNTWVNIPWLTAQGSGKPAFYYAFNATVGAAHTFTVNDADGAICVMAFSGVKSVADPLESANDIAALSGTNTYQASAPITPASAGDLVITAFGDILSATPLTMFLSVDQHNLTGGLTGFNNNDSAGAIAFSIANDNTTPLQPTWTALDNNTQLNRGYNNFAVFKHA